MSRQERGIETKNVAHCRSFSQPQFASSVANQTITMNAFVLNGWQCEVGGKNSRALLTSYPALTFFLQRLVVKA